MSGEETILNFSKVSCNSSTEIRKILRIAARRHVECRCKCSEENERLKNYIKRTADFIKRIKNQQLALEKRLNNLSNKIKSFQHVQMQTDDYPSSDCNLKELASQQLITNYNCVENTKNSLNTTLSLPIYERINMLKKQRALKTLKPPAINHAKFASVPSKSTSIMNHSPLPSSASNLCSVNETDYLYTHATSIMKNLISSDSTTEVVNKSSNIANGLVSHSASAEIASKMSFTKRKHDMKTPLLPSCPQKQPNLSDSRRENHDVIYLDSDDDNDNAVLGDSFFIPRTV